MSHGSDNVVIYSLDCTVCPVRHSRRVLGQFEAPGKTP